MWWHIQYMYSPACCGAGMYAHVCLAVIMCVSVLVLWCQLYEWNKRMAGCHRPHSPSVNMGMCDAHQRPTWIFLSGGYFSSGQEMETCASLDQIKFDLFVSICWLTQSPWIYLCDLYHYGCFSQTMTMMHITSSQQIVILESFELVLVLHFVKYCVIWIL